ncbi:hypothetical protein CPT03_17695 [Pedobacter ginsengisoli]|uniref:3-methyl-2-oxobutanoate hydroxymethyltransferase n=1 Tax=Pedobacter ginsengisoli TaxID=363852 RepID=A0A2D1U9A0_9SPHI|nr:nuclear transport factor 2 family protein [Pedobacter ginsengisoli]ATP58166.1 hypothetical protein CPT03_17695 [Pedobacter ginsengisoli]
MKQFLKIKKRNFLIIVFLLTAINVTGQIQQHEEDLVKATINKLFEGMKNTDSAMVSNAFASNAIMQSIHKSKDGEFKLTDEKVSDFIKFTGTSHKEKFDERIIFTKILIDGNLASVWTDYKFYIDNKFSHCGVNSFQLFKDKTTWKIIYIVDTRRKENCL